MLSIIVCTYRRAKYLNIVLESLVRQSADKEKFEVIIVDNASELSCLAIVEKFVKILPGIRYVSESCVGLSYARNRGFMEAKGEYVAYVDDDCELPFHWVQRSIDIINSISPECFGGPVFPLFQNRKPRWFKEDYLIYDFGKQRRFLQNSEYLIGCNFVVRKSLLEKTGGFDVQFGMAGIHIGYSEETEFQIRVRQIFPDLQIVYDPNLPVHHLVRPEKMTLSWAVGAFFAKGQANFLLSNFEFGAYTIRALLDTGFGLLVESLKISLLLIFGAALRSRSKFQYFENYVYERLVGNFKKLGYQWRRLLELYKAVY